MQEFEIIEDIKFKLKTEKPQKGIFYFVRYLWNTHVNGKRWQIIIFNTVLLLVFMPLAFIFDIAIIILFLMWQGFKQLIKSLWNLIFSLTKSFFTKTVYPTLKFIIQIVLFISLVIILIYKFDFIKDLIINVFETIFIKPL